MSPVYLINPLLKYLRILLIFFSITNNTEAIIFVYQSLHH